MAEISSDIQNLDKYPGDMNIQYVINNFICFTTFYVTLAC